MSVRTGDRTEGTLGVLNDIANLGAYTIQICKSEKVFPKSSRWVKQRRKMKKLMAKERAGSLSEGTTRNSFIAWRANAKRGDTFYQRQRMEHYFYDLKGRKTNDPEQ